MNIGNLISMIKRYGSSGASEVVILPETELMGEAVDAFGQYALATPLENYPAAGSTCKLMWGGEKFSGKVVDATDTLGEGRFACYAMGNLAIMTGGVVPDGIPNPDPTAPYFLAMFPDGFAIEEGLTKQYVIMYSQGITPDPPVLSIVQVGAASGGGSASAGGGVVKILHASTDFDPNAQTFSNSQAVETYADMRSVYDNDGLLWCRLKMNFVVDGAVQFSASVECPCAGCDDEVISFTPLGTMASMGILASLKNDDTFTVEID